MHSKAQGRWQEARKRMRARIDAVLWQDIGISSPERESYVDWILDRIFKDEYVAVFIDDWTVWRQDDNGNLFIVEKNLGYEGAQSLVASLEARGHKQFYWYKPTAEG